MNAYSYLRFSTPEQALGDSERRQVEKADAWATAKGIPLDQSYADRGKSGFKGTNRKKGALGEFLKEIKAHNVPRGSYLLVENLDRLSREHPIDSFALLKEIMSAGITIVVLKENPVEYSDLIVRSDRTGMKMVELSFELGRASGESARKSDLGIDNWKEKRRLATEENKPMTVMAPAWIKSVTTGEGRRKERRYELDSKRAKVVREMFTEHKAGKGLRTIAKILNDRKEPNWGRGDRIAKMWHKTYIQKILSNPAVLGNFQPHKFVTIPDPENPAEQQQIRVPVGEVLTSYYPPIFITPEEIELANYVLKKVRKRAQGPTGGKIQTRISNLFPGLLFGSLPDPACPCPEPSEPGSAPTAVIPCRYKSQHGHGHGQYIITDIVPVNKARKKKDHLTSERWPYPPVEFAVLKTLEEIDWAAVAGEARTPEQHAIASRISALETKVGVLQTGCDNIGLVIRKNPLPTLVRDLAELEAQKQTIELETDELRKQLDHVETSRKGLLAPLPIQEAAHDPENLDVRYALRAELACRIKRILLTPKTFVEKKHPGRNRIHRVYAFGILIEFANGVTRSIRIHLNPGADPTISTKAFQPPQNLPLPPANPEDDSQADNDI
jgi:DNA invertase Pin-like site-specific DNA recombinase